MDAQVLSSVGMEGPHSLPPPHPPPVLSPGLYQEVHLEELTVAELTGKLAELLGLPAGQIQQVSRQGPSGIHILVSDVVRTRGDTWACWTPQPSQPLGVPNLLPARLSPRGCPSLQRDGGPGSGTGHTPPARPPLTSPGGPTDDQEPPGRDVLHGGRHQR